MKPTLRQTPHIDMYSAFNDAIRKNITQNEVFPFQNCLNCKYWNFGKEICNKYNIRPPVEIIVYSCPDYEDYNEIPY